MICEHEYMNISPPPPIIELATALVLPLGLDIVPEFVYSYNNLDDSGASIDE